MGLVSLGRPLEEGVHLAAQRVVEQRLDLAATAVLLLEVDLQQVLQGLLVHDVQDAREEHRPGTLLVLCLQCGQLAVDKGRHLDGVLGLQEDDVVVLRQRQTFSHWWRAGDPSGKTSADLPS